LSYVDLLGTTYSASTLATGYGAYIALPLLRQAVEGREDSLSEEEARKIMVESMRVLFYRDARSLNKVSFFSPTLRLGYGSSWYQRSSDWTRSHDGNAAGWAYTDSLVDSSNWRRSPRRALTFRIRLSLKQVGALRRAFEATAHRRNKRAARIVRGLFSICITNVFLFCGLMMCG
jgi:hypothetical protein